MIKVSDVIQFLGAEIVQVWGEAGDLTVSKLKPSAEVDRDTLDWIGNNRLNKQQIAEGSPAKVIVCDPTVLYSHSLHQQGKILLQVINPKIAVARIAERFFARHPLPGIHPTAVVDPEAKIAASAHVGPHCSIGKCIIGEGALVYANTVVGDDVLIGSEVVIHSGAVLGTETLSCEREADGSLVNLPHLGRLIIQDRVVIGANTVIARGTLSDTVIGQGSKISAGCSISHNCQIGRNVWISLGAAVAGSSRIEDNVTVWSKVIIRDNCVIGIGATIGMGSIVTRNIPAGETWLGSPARKAIR